MQVRKQQLELDMEQQTSSKKEKEYVKAVPLQSNNCRLKLSAFLVCSFEPIPRKTFHVLKPLGIISL